MMSHPRPFSIAVDESGESTRLVRIAMFIIIVLLGGTFAWGLLAPMSGAVIAAGIIKVESSRKSVQHLEGGIIRKILVKEGAQVEAGQPLLELADTDTSSNLNILVDTLNVMLAKEARLFAESSRRDVIEFSEELKSNRSDKMLILLRDETALFQSKRNTLEDQTSLLKSQIAHAGNAITNIRSQIRATKDGIHYLKEQLRAVEKLIQKRYIDNNSLLELKQKLSAKREALGSYNATLARQHQDISELELRIINLRNEYAKNAGEELKKTRKTILETRERIRPAKDILQRRTITSPMAGQVIDLKATTIGGVIKPGDVILDIVPQKVNLILEVKIKPSDADVVHIGQAVKIQLSAFNQRTTPMVDGTLTYISGDALIDESSGNRQHFFLGHIKTHSDSLKQIPDFSLSPGMPVVAYVETESRTFFQYLLSPLTSQMRRSLVE